MSRDSTVGSINISDLLDALGRLGADPRALLKEAGLGEKTLRDPETRVSSSLLLSLFDVAERRLGDRLVGLHAAERVQPRGALFYLLFSSPRFSEGLGLFKRFAHIGLDSLEVRIAISGEVASLTIEPGDPAIERSHHAVDYLVGAVLASIRRTVPGFRQIGVDLAHARVGDPAEVERVFGCPVRFDCRRNILRFPASALRRPAAGANAAIAEQIKRYTTALLARVSSKRIQDRASHAIRALLMEGIRAERWIVARRLGMSERTLKRHLQQEGVTFKTVRDRLRAETAQALLSNRALKVEHVAQSVGFAEAASFSRAFTRWSGTSPARFRQRLGGTRRPSAHSTRHHPSRDPA